MCAAVSVVRGEAAESESSEEEELRPDVAQKNIGNIPKAEIVPGEASESDEEPSPSLSSQTTKTYYETRNSTASDKVYKSLLHKKLSESNISLYNSVLSLVRNTVQNSVTQLTAADQQLLKSQLRLQQASSSLRSLDLTSKQLAERLSIAASSTFIPKISIPIPDADLE